MIDILVPVLGRPHRAAPLAENIHSVTTEEHRIVFLCSRGDTQQIEACFATQESTLVMQWPAGRADYSMKVNAGFWATGSEWVMNAADDLTFEPRWDTTALKLAGAKYHVVGTNDLANAQVKRGQFGTHCLIRRRYVTETGASADHAPGMVLHEGYDHNFCNPPDAPVWMADGTFRPIGDVGVGDTLVGWERIEAEAGRVGTPRRALAYSEVLEVTRRVSPLVRVSMESGRQFDCTPDHRWLNASWSPASSYPDNQFVIPEVGRQLLHVVDEPTPLPPGTERLAGWLAGIYDGEGSGIYVATQSLSHNPRMVTAISEALNSLAVPHRMTIRKSGVAEFVLHGGRQGYLDFLLRFDPVRREQLLSHILGWRQLDTSRKERAPIGGRRFGMSDRIVEVEPLEGQSEVVALTTSTGNYIAHGYASKNCDRELSHVAQSRGVFVFARHSRVKHSHKLWRTAPDDATYRKALRHFRQDQQLFLSRAHLWGYVGLSDPERKLAA